jgi:hypothetical protein
VFCCFLGFARLLGFADCVGCWLCRFFGFADSDLICLVWCFTHAQITDVDLADDIVLMDSFKVPLLAFSAPCVSLALLLMLDSLTRFAARVSLVLLALDTTRRHLWSCDSAVVCAPSCCSCSTLFLRLLQKLLTQNQCHGCPKLDEHVRTAHSCCRGFIVISSLLRLTAILGCR